MRLTLEALQANDGDCLLLHYLSSDQPSGGAPVRVLIDGGSAGIYSSILKPRLDQLRGRQPLRLRMAMVSHIDADHITGILDLFRALEEQQVNGEDGFCQIQTLWHNSFEALHGGKHDVAEEAFLEALAHDAGSAKAAFGLQLLCERQGRSAGDDPTRFHGNLD
jgi:glyoxylase-like metal-dependent hydrolase (beta-lactamase superfamily II)